jgi:hypothetical protein
MIAPAKHGLGVMSARHPFLVSAVVGAVVLGCGALVSDVWLYETLAKPKVLAGKDVPVHILGACLMAVTMPLGMANHSLLSALAMSAGGVVGITVFDVAAFLLGGHMQSFAIEGINEYYSVATHLEYIGMKFTMVTVLIIGGYAGRRFTEYIHKSADGALLIDRV